MRLLPLATLLVPVASTRWSRGGSNPLNVAGAPQQQPQQLRDQVVMGGAEEPLEAAGAVAAGRDRSGFWRPQVHFSPPSNWLNDPNGLFRDSRGVWHMYYQCE